MLFLVHKNNIEISEEELVNEGEVNVTICHFTFDNVYGTLAKKAIFTNIVQGVPYEVPITNNECVLPYEVCNAEGKILVGVYAYEIENDQVVLRYSPKPVKIEISEGSYIANSANPGHITPTQYEVYEEALNSALDRLNQEIAKVDDALKSGKLDGPANTLTIGTIVGGEGAAATITGDAPNQTLNLVLPKGDTGATGPANSLSIGTVVSGSTASATITGTSPNQTLNLVLPKGDTGPQGTTDFDDLTNRPSYNGTTMDSTTNIPEVVTYTNFTGTDGVDPGTAGLVPAPATTDAGKFLKSDGTWDTAGGGGDTVYSDKSTSNSSTGGAVYIGNLDASQDEQADPTTTDNHYKYFWALPTDNTKVPTDGSVNILSERASPYSVVIGMGAYDSNNSNANSNIIIGPSAYASGETYRGIAIGDSAHLGTSGDSVALGRNATIGNYAGKSVALGSNSNASRVGEVNIGNSTGGGYNNTNYRVLGGVHDGQLANDAVTVSQVNATIDAINTALSTSIPHIGA